MNNNLEYFFVYGTLKSGYGNNRILQQSPTALLVENAATAPEFNLYDLGPYPGVTEGGDTSIKGEIWSVSDVATKNRLDMLEGYNPIAPDKGHYNKKIIDINDKKVNIYLINRQYTNTTNKINSGLWER